MGDWIRHAKSRHVVPGGIILTTATNLTTMSDDESIDDEMPTGIFPGETDAPGGSSAGGISGILGAGAVGGSVKPTKRPRKSRSASSSSRTRPVVKLMVTSVSRSYVEPWRRKTQRERCVLCCLFDVYVRLM